MSAEPLGRAGSLSRLLKIAFITAVAAAGFNSVSPIADYLAISPNGSEIWLWYAGCSVVPVMLAANAVVLIGLILLIWRKTRPAASILVVSSVVYFAVAAGMWNLGGEIRMRSFEELAERSKPLVFAIRRFEKDNGRPPASLQQLVPGYIKSIPPTGMGAYPKYEYEVGERAIAYYDGNPWVLWVDTPSGGINWDMFLYYPRQNYPQQGHGGWLERVQDWAYVHE